jgi:tetratricopeptide (TPR) repeat protein
MDLTTLTFAVMLAISALGLDTIWHHGDVMLASSAAGKLDKSSLDVTVMSLILQDEVNRISATPSVVARPRIRTNDAGIGMAIATAANMQSLVYALQGQVGFQPDKISLALFSENGAAKVLISGSGNSRPSVTFEQVVTQQKDEAIEDLVHRAALVGLARIDPYITALNLMRRHEFDKNFADVLGLIEFTKSLLPPTPNNTDRSLLENLQGIVALFGGDSAIAHAWFQQAIESSPDNVIGLLNLAFADLQIAHYQPATDRMRDLVTLHRPADPVVLCTAYATWAAARLGDHDINGADELMALAIEANPGSAMAYNLWSDVKREKGDPEAAERLRAKALRASASFENYAEVAALYFQLAWRDHQAVTTSQFRNPVVVGFH